MTEHPNATVRLQAIRRLAELVEREVHETVDPSIPVFDHDPGGDLPKEAIYTISVVGDVDPASLAGGTDTPTEDVFIVTLVARAGKQGQRSDDAYDRVDQLYQCVRNVALGVEYGHDLGGLDGICHTELATVDGPYCGPEDKTTWLGLYRIDIRITTDEVTA